MNTPEEFEALKKENENLKNNNAAKSDLISVSAHQLRTSLSALKWILKMLLNKDAGEISAEQEGLLERSYKSNERMITLVNNMLTLSHIEDAAIKFNKTDTDIVSLIEETLFEFFGESHQKSIEIIFLKPEKPISNIVCDKEMIRVVLQNLTENAIKYSKEGDKIFCSVRENGDNIEFSIRDAGIGIPEVDQPNIFNKFFRAPNAKEKDIIGSGLGLYTVKYIVDQHNGKVWFESNTKGTTFFVVLPLKD